MTHMIDENEMAGGKASDGNLEYPKLSGVLKAKSIHGETVGCD